MQNQLLNQQKKISPLGEILVACRIMIKYVLIFGFILNCLMLAMPLFSMQVLDRVLSSRSMDTLLALTLITVFCLILNGFLYGARALAINKMSAWFEHKLGSTVFKNAMKLSLIVKGGASSQQVRDLQVIKNYITNPSLIVMMDIPWSFIFVIALGFLHIYMALLAIIGGCICLTIGIIADKNTRKLVEGHSETVNRSMEYVNESISASDVSEVMGMTPNVINNWQKFNSKVQSSHNLLIGRQSVMSEIVKFVRQFLQVCITCMGAYLVCHDQMSSGGMIASSSLMARALAPFDNALQYWKVYINCKKSYERLNSTFMSVQDESNMISLPEPQGNISLENVYFAPYGTQKYLIKGINLEIKHGEIVIVIGPSGSGKSTLIRLLIGSLMATVGTVRIDGSSIKDWKRSELGMHIGYVPQDVELMKGTIRENIGRMDPKADSEMVIQAAQIAGVHDMILRLPDGYDTQIGQGGSSLSGGQRQRIAIARAIFGDPKILVLDEADASLDAAGKAAIDVLIEIAKERQITVVMITHHSEFISRVADKICVVNDGVITAFGTPSEIASKMRTTQQQIKI